ncbi:MAG TPA: hypothetical protein VGX48_02095 [Pyrinomonadaceae bacterium]|nr:hypothetical protein [Pyrinomonadaceae bacterium]
MTRQQLIEEIKQLSVAERVALIEAISRTLREDLVTPDASNQAATVRATVFGSGHTAEAEQPPLSQRLSGVLKFDGDPPTDEEVKDAYADYLVEKYS